jgi:hypothetical protein
MLDLWAQLSPELKTVACGTLAGVVLWAVQKWWTNCPLLGWLGPDSGTAKKRLTAVLLAVGAGVGAAYTAGGDVQVGIGAAIAAYTAGQATFLAAEKTGKNSEPGGLP